MVVGGGPKVEQAPVARLTGTSGKETVAPAGTRCWGQVCVDMIGPLTQSAPTKLKSGEALSVAFDAGTPSAADYSWTTGPSQPAPVEGGYVAWRPDPQAAKASPPLRAPERPGRYLLVVFARWQGKGDISYAWYLEVE